MRPGVVGGLAHSYALTSHAAQGETYAAGRHLASDASNREGVYVGLSRGSRAAALYVVRRQDPRAHETTVSAQAAADVASRERAETERLRRESQAVATRGERLLAQAKMLVALVLVAVLIVVLVVIGR